MLDFDEEQHTAYIDEQREEEAFIFSSLFRLLGLLLLLLLRVMGVFVFWTTPLCLSLSLSLSCAFCVFSMHRVHTFVEQERGECRERKVVVGVAFLLLLLVQKRRRDDPRPVSRRDSRFPGVDPLPFRLVQLLVARFPSEAFVQRTPGVSTRPRDRHRSAFHALVVVSLVRRALREREFFHDGDQSFFFLLEHARPVVGRRATRVHRVVLRGVVVVWERKM